MSHDTVPGLDSAKAAEITKKLQKRLTGTLDLQLTIKHIHWNVVGPSFIGVHEMLDDQVGPVRTMSDEIAERIAILGGEPKGTPGFIVKDRDWDDYPINRAGVKKHLTELEKAYGGMIEDHRTAISEVAEMDPITEDMLVSQASKLELYQWFVRSHIESV